jgi:hypothetical protein
VQDGARMAAVQLAGSLLKDHPQTFWSLGEWRLHVRDQAGAPLFSLHILATEA